MNPNAAPIDWTALMVVALTAAVMVFLIRRLTHGMDRQDWILLRQVRSRGIDVSRPQPVDFVMFTASHETALELTDVMRKDGYQTNVAVAQIQYARNRRKPGATQEGWLVKGTQVLQLGPDELKARRKSLLALASAHKASYLGWQVATPDAQGKPQAPG